MSDEQRFRIELGYDGTFFHGSQIQPGVRTVQGALESAAQRVTNRAVRLAFAGRTDRGVHAIGQVASGDMVWRASAGALGRALQALTPDDLMIHRVASVNRTFHARFSARSREYRYQIWSGPSSPVMSRSWSWHIRHQLDCDAMSVAAGALVGEHDFAAFAGNGLGVPGAIASRSTIRRVIGIDVSVAETPESDVLRDSRMIVVRITATGFLPQMVRNVVGALVSVGLGVSDDIPRLLESKDRRLAPAPAPPHGLTFWRVDYGETNKTAGSGMCESRSTGPATRR